MNEDADHAGTPLGWSPEELDRFDTLAALHRAILFHARWTLFATVYLTTLLLFTFTAPLWLAWLFGRSVEIIIVP